jgi:hypothetical protein
VAKSLKQRNQPQLITFVIANAIALGVLLQGLKEELSLLEGMTKGNFAILGKLIAIPAALTLVIGILGWAVPKRWKETVIFWRGDKHCLPSSRAFSAIAKNDPRIDVKRLTEKNDPLPIEPSQQTALWYRLYRKNAENPAVEDAHCAYLRYREMTALAIGMMPSFLIAAGLLRPSGRSLLGGVLLIVAEYLLLMLAARHAAEHFVSNVLAVESAAP